MKQLLTKEIIRALNKHPLYSQDGKGENANIITKYYHPQLNWNWYILEGQKEDNGDWLFFGIVDGHFREYGYFTLSSIQENGGERDTHFNGAKVRDINNKGYK